MSGIRTRSGSVGGSWHRRQRRSRRADRVGRSCRRHRRRRHGWARWPRRPGRQRRQRRDRRDRRSGRRFRAGRQRGRRRRGWVTGWQLRHPGQYGPARHPGRRRIVVAVRREHHARRTARTRTAATVSARGAADPGILRGPRRWCRRPHGHAGRRTRAGTPSVALLHRLLCADSQLPHINGPRREVTVVSLIPNTE